MNNDSRGTRGPAKPWKSPDVTLLSTTDINGGALTVSRELSVTNGTYNVITLNGVKVAVDVNIYNMFHS